MPSDRATPDNPAETTTSNYDERAAMREALQTVWNALGPEPVDCGCLGCETEMQDALDAVEPFVEDPYEERGDDAE